MTKQFDINNLKKYGQNIFSNMMEKATRKYQQKYGFDIGQGNNPTWNNESDAFRHAYMQWWLFNHSNSKYARRLGDEHENTNPNNPSSERNMDLWNNSIGREVAHEIIYENPDDLGLYTDEMLNDMAAEKIVRKMRAGEMITNPNDLRRFENMEMERLNDEDRVFYNGEFSNIKEKVDNRIMSSYLNQAIENNWKIDDKATLDKRVSDGELIYIDNYVKANGKRLKGYYKRRPVR